MFRKTLLLFVIGITLAACSSDKPHVTTIKSDMQEIGLTAGIATQVEAPDGRKIQSAVIGDPSMADLDVVDNVLNIFPKDRPGRTNLIMRAADEDGEVKVYQYMLVVYKKN